MYSGIPDEAELTSADHTVQPIICKLYVGITIQ